MCTTSTGTRFQDLPLELHLIIWDLAVGSTFTTQVYPLRWQSQSPSSPAEDTLSLTSVPNDTPLLIPGDCPAPHFIFQLCHKSRLYAFSKGYRIWCFKSHRDEVRHINWNPARDIIVLPAHIAANSVLQNTRRPHPLTILRNDFPLETKQIRRLAVRHCVRCRTKKQTKSLIGRLVPLTSLKELVLMEEEDPDDLSQWVCSTHISHLQTWNGHGYSPSLGLSKLPRSFTKALEMRSAEVKVEKIIVIPLSRETLDADKSHLTFIKLTGNPRPLYTGSEQT